MLLFLVLTVSPAHLELAGPVRAAARVPSAWHAQAGALAVPAAPNEELRLPVCLPRAQPGM